MGRSTLLSKKGVTEQSGRRKNKETMGYFTKLMVFIFLPPLQS